MTGRVVRCTLLSRRAAIGSFARHWAHYGHGTAAHDPTDAAPAMERTHANSFPTTSTDDGGDLVDGSIIPVSALYTSSVEMVTTPEEYPVWRTLKPVVVVWHHSYKHHQHHYYRYLVVSPGGGISEFHANGGGGVDNGDNNNMNAVEMETDMDDYPHGVDSEELYKPSSCSGKIPLQSIESE
jgi:hypothetical protein